MPERKRFFSIDVFPIQLCSSIAITTLFMFNQSINFAFLLLCIFASLETIVLHCNCRLKIVSFQAFPEFAECNRLRSSIAISFLSRGFQFHLGFILKKFKLSFKSKTFPCQLEISNSNSSSLSCLVIHFKLYRGK